MKKYLQTIHQRSPAHKKRFALLASGGTTLIIFGIWSLVMFGGKSTVVAVTAEGGAPPEAVVSPFEEIKGGVANSIDAVKSQMDQIKQTIQSVNLEDEYQQARDQALTN